MEMKFYGLMEAIGMKVTQYLTTAGLEFVTRPVFRSEHMNGALRVSRTEKTVTKDFLGFGVALTGSACYDLALMEKEERTALLRDLYAKEGLNLSVGRIPVGSCDYSAELYTYDDVPGDVSLEHFSIDRDRAYIIPMIREILEINPDLFLFASPWSPPAWMKTGNNICGGFMRDEYVECYAEYIVRFIEEYAKCGIRISAITPQNETETHQHGLMPACIWHPETEAKFVLALRRKLNERGLDVKIWIYDHNFDGWERVLWSLESCAGLKDACDGAAFHYYRGTLESTLAIREKFPDFPLHFTEGGPRVTDHYDTDWCKWSMMMSRALNSAYGSFTGWNLMLDENGGPNVGPFLCGGLITRNSVTGALTYSGQSKAFRHISHFMQKGAEVCEVELGTNVPALHAYPKTVRPLQVSAFKNPDGTVVYIVVNPAEAKQQVEIVEGGVTYYLECLPDSLSTVVFEA